jgi:hypothetical protein
MIFSFHRLIQLHLSKEISLNIYSIGVWNLFSNGQTRIDYIIGLRTGDIGDYTPPSERLYTQVFNQTGLQTLVYTRYVPGYSQSIPINSNNPGSSGPFYYRTGPFYGVRIYWTTIIDNPFF